jgi:selenide, water dikinase
MGGGAFFVGVNPTADNEPKYGLAVTGLVDPAEMTTNAGGRPGDALVLTKPLGVGAIVTARKRGAAGDDVLAAAVATMTELNADAAAAARTVAAHAVTDVTGFGMLGHLHHLARESGLAATVDAAAVPVIDGVEAILHDDRGVSGGSRRNAEWAAGFSVVADDVPPWRRRLVTDATTSGGLLIAADPIAAESLPGPIIGRLGEGPPGSISVL